MSVFEILIGIFLIFGILKKITSFSLLCLIGMFAAVTFYIIIFPDSGIKDCGCFGDAFKLTNTETFIKNIILLALAFTYVKTLYKFDWVESNDKSVVKIIIAVTISLFIPMYSIIFLPVYDYLPFNVGVNLRKQQENQYIEFNVLDKNFNSITEEIINSRNDVFIMIVKDFQNISLQRIIQLNQIIKKIKELNFKFYIVTSSDINELECVLNISDHNISYAIMDNTSLNL